MTIETTMASTDLSNTRGIVYQWISNLILLEPNEKNFRPFVKDNIISAIKEMVEEKDYGSVLIQAMVNWRDNPEYRNKMILDFNDLFHVPGPKYIYPFESCYREKLVDDAIGKIYGCCTIEVNQLYQIANISFDINEIPDHLGLELLFISELCLLENAHLENKSFEEAEKYNRWQEGFLNDHLLQWAFDVLKNMEEKAETEFYRSIALMLKDFLNEEKLLNA